MALSHAFSAVIVALIATIIIYNVKRRWYLSELCEIQKLRGECNE